MSDIVRRETGNQPARGGGRAVQPGHQASVDVDGWEGAVLVLHEHAPALPDLGGPEIATQLVLLPGVVRRAGATYRLRRGWRAQPGGVTVVDIKQPLRATPTGAYATTGPWGAPEVTTHRPVALPTRKKGDVSNDGVPATPRPAGSSGGARPHPHDRDAMESLSYLPVSVQRSVTTGVPDHTVFVAQAVRSTRSDGSHYHRVRALRLGPTKAVVVVAARQDRATAWQVELVRYDLTAGTPLEERRRAGALE